MDCVKEEPRSISPQCPKPNESEEPQGTTVEKTISRNDSANMNVKDEVEELVITKKEEKMEVVITKEMEEEERQLMEEGERKDKEMMEKAQKNMGKDTQDMRFRRLQHLLEKSNIYSKFLLTKMEQQQQEEKIRRERLEKKALTTEEKQVSKKKNERVDKKKREREEDYKIADIMSKEEIMSKAKKQRTENPEASTSKGVLEDIEKMSRVCVAGI